MHAINRQMVSFGAAAAGAAVLLVSGVRGAAPACDPDNGGIKLPAGFCALVAADGLGPARHLVAASNGDVYGHPARQPG
jgi:hypothetical protein